MYTDYHFKTKETQFYHKSAVLTTVDSRDSTILNPPRCRNLKF